MLLKGMGLGTLLISLMIRGQEVVNGFSLSNIRLI